MYKLGLIFLFGIVLSNCRHITCNGRPCNWARTMPAVSSYAHQDFNRHDNYMQQQYNNDNRQTYCKEVPRYDLYGNFIRNDIYCE